MGGPKSAASEGSGWY